MIGLVLAIALPLWLLFVVLAVVLARGIRLADSIEQPDAAREASLSADTVARMDSTSPIPATLGWSNAGPTDLQLYALDAGPSPRWIKNGDGTAGRTVEHALAERGAHEGDRFLLVRVGDRHEAARTLPEGWMEQVGQLWQEIGKEPYLAPTPEQTAELIRRAPAPLAAALVAHLQLQLDESQRCWIEDHAGEIRRLREQRAASVEKVAAAIRCYAEPDPDAEAGADVEELTEISEHADLLAHVLVERGLIRG